MSVLTDHIADPLLTFIEPQIEQLHIDMKPIRCGVYGSINNEIASGYLWAASLRDDCLISRHHLILHEPMMLDEHPSKYCCIVSSSEATIDSSEELLKIAHPHKFENLCTFSSNGGDISCLLKPNMPYDSVSVSYTPQFFRKLKTYYPNTYDHIEEGLDTLPPELLPNSLRALLRTLNPTQAMKPGSELFFQAKILEALSLLVPKISYLESSGHLKESSQERLPYEIKEQDLERTIKSRTTNQTVFSDENLRIVNETKVYIANHLSRHITLEEVAKHLYLSRSKLCSIFQEEVGTSIGIYIRKLRINQACDLLINTDLNISEIGALVGYPRASSFTETFLRETRQTPREYRSKYRAS